MPQLSVIIPVLNEQSSLPGLLEGLRGRVEECLVVDGGSTDQSREIAHAGGVRVLLAPPGRGPQLNLGATASQGELLWFLHADSGVPPALPAAIRQASLLSPWGCCTVQIADTDLRLRFASATMNWRAARTGLCTGDMGIWVRRSFFEETGGFSELPALEDLDYSERARKVALPKVVEGPLRTSSRRWRQEGMMRTVLRMWLLRASFHLGADRQTLAEWYRSHPR